MKPESIESLVITHRGIRAVVRRNDGHPEHYLFVDALGGHYFLGVLEHGMTRGDVRRLAREWIERRVPGHEAHARR